MGGSGELLMSQIRCELLFAKHLTNCKGVSYGEGRKLPEWPQPDMLDRTGPSRKLPRGFRRLPHVIRNLPHALRSLTQVLGKAPLGVRRLPPGFRNLPHTKRSLAQAFGKAPLGLGKLPVCSGRLPHTKRNVPSHSSSSTRKPKKWSLKSSRRWSVKHPAKLLMMPNR